MSLFSNASIPTVVVENLKIEDSGDLRVQVNCRPKGFISWLMAKFSGGGAIDLEVHENYVSWTLGGYEVIPMAAVSNIFYGYTSAFWALILGIISLVAGFVYPFAFLLALIFIAIYIGSRKRIFSITPASGDAMTLAFYKDGKMTAEDGAKIVQILIGLVDAAAKK